VIRDAAKRDVETERMPWSLTLGIMGNCWTRHGKRLPSRLRIVITSNNMRGSRPRITANDSAFHMQMEIAESRNLDFHLPRISHVPRLMAVLDRSD